MIKNSRKEYIGIDFSGAKDAYKKIWLASGNFQDNQIKINSVKNIKEYNKDISGITDTFDTLRNIIIQSSHSVFGIDFPFSLPKFLIHESTYIEFLNNFTQRYSNPETFRVECFNNAEEFELKRKCDEESKTPFSPYNIRVYKQTFYGIREILVPLIKEEKVSILPFQEPNKNKPWIIEICPASTLKQLKINKIYKNLPHNQSQEILESLLKDLTLRFNLRYSEEDMIKIINNKEGDAIDSVIALIASICSMKAPFSYIFPKDDNDIYCIEGYVYTGIYSTTKQIGLDNF